jgi:hypothetical protein
MADECGIYDLPLEIIYALASTDVAVYRALLALPRFARSLGPGAVVDFMIAFGYTVKITADYIEWFLNGRRHRIDGPAVVWMNGYKFWYRFGKLHRSPDNSDLDSVGGQSVGPAVECDACKEWWLDGKQHRIDGPAVEHPTGAKYWYIFGELHRDGGPAVEYGDGSKEWWLFGEQQPDQYEELTSLEK